MFFRYRSRWLKWRFNAQIADILKTPPVTLVDAPWSIISMMSHSDMLMYLLGMKAFYARLGAGKIVAIIDRNEPDDMRRTLRKHLVGITFVHIQDIDVGACQRGGTWERLVYLLDHARNEYAIQMDSDVLAFGPDIAEVRRCIADNVAFTLGNAGRPINTMAHWAQDAKQVESNYVGNAAERLFDRYPDAETTRYVRASSGFAGFAKGGFDRAGIERFHREMQKLLPERWHEWGTEQCGSNFAVANSPGAVVLPYPKYANFWPGLERDRSALLHFIGAHRYLDGYFARLGRKVIAELMEGAPPGSKTGLR